MNLDLTAYKLIKARETIRALQEALNERDTCLEQRNAEREALIIEKIDLRREKEEFKSELSIALQKSRNAYKGQQDAELTQFKQCEMFSSLLRDIRDKLHTGNFEVAYELVVAWLKEPKEVNISTLDNFDKERKEIAELKNENAELKEKIKWREEHLIKLLNSLEHDCQVGSYNIAHQKIINCLTFLKLNPEGVPCKDAQHLADSLHKDTATETQQLSLKLSASNTSLLKKIDALTTAVADLQKTERESVVRLNQLERFHLDSRKAIDSLRRRNHELKNNLNLAIENDSRLWKFQYKTNENHMLKFEEEVEAINNQLQFSWTAINEKLERIEYIIGLRERNPSKE